MNRIPSLALVLVAGLPAACTEGSGSEDAGVTAPDAGPPPVWVVETGVPTKEDLFGIWGTAKDDVYAVGWAGTILHYDGAAWSKEVTTATVALSDVGGFVPDDPMMPASPVFAVGWGGHILRRASGGTWSKEQVLDMTGMPTSTLTQDLFGLHVGGVMSALAVGARGRVVGWDGTKWQLQHFVVPGEFSGQPIEPLGVLKGVWSATGDRYYISGSGGAAYRSSGGFASFEALDTRVNQPLRGVWGLAGGPVYTVGLDGLILRFDGQWRRVTNQGASELPAAFFFDVAGTSSDDITVVGWRGVIARHLQGAWSVEPSGTAVDLRALWIDQATGTAWAVGASGLILRRDPPPPSGGAGDAGTSDGGPDAG